MKCYLINTCFKGQTDIYFLGQLSNTLVFPSGIIVCAVFCKNNCFSSFSVSQCRK